MTDRRPLLLGASLALLIGTVGVAALPGAAYAWTLLGGLGMGVLFTIMLTLPLDLSAHPTEAGAIAGVMLAGGYTTAALAPVLLGALRDATGSFSAVLAGVAVTAAVLVGVLSLVPRVTPRSASVAGAGA